MSKKIVKPFLFQTLKGKSISFTADEKKIIKALKPLEGSEWSGDIKAGCTVNKNQRDKLVTDIKSKLVKIQGDYCIYCGIHKSYCGTLQREHIAPKGNRLYPHFMFEPQNLALACHQCNVDLKGQYKTIDEHNEKNYKKCTFLIIHPYLDDIFDHIEFVVEEGKVILGIKVKGDKKAEKTLDKFKLDSPARTTLRSALFNQSEKKFDSKYDKTYTQILNNEYFKK